jgi:hypothetical protein
MRGFKTAPSCTSLDSDHKFPGKNSFLYCILSLLLFTQTCGYYLTSELTSEREREFIRNFSLVLLVHRTGRCLDYFQPPPLHLFLFLLLAVSSSIIHTTQMRAPNLSVRKKESKKATIKKLYPIHQKRVSNSCVARVRERVCVCVCASKTNFLSLSGTGRRVIWAPRPPPSSQDRHDLS